MSNYTVLLPFEHEAYQWQKWVAFGQPRLAEVGHERPLNVQKE